MLGLDPFYVANEGKLVAIVSGEVAEEVLAAMRRARIWQRRRHYWEGGGGASRSGHGQNHHRRYAGGGCAGRGVIAKDLLSTSARHLEGAGHFMNATIHF